MKTVIKHGIRIALAAFITVLLCIGCAYFNKQSETEPVAEPVAAPSVRDDTETTPEAKLPTPADETNTNPPEAMPTTIQEVNIEKSEKPAYYVHTVRWPGEMLYIISKWYTGKFKNSIAIANANPKLNPNRIFIGNKILIPEALLKTSEPMPKSFVSQFVREEKRKTSPTKPLPQSTSSEPSEEEEPELFGPREYQKE